MARLKVLIAGGGIGGMAAALALINRGHDVDVYEQAPELKEFLKHEAPQPKSSGKPQS